MLLALADAVLYVSLALLLLRSFRRHRFKVAGFVVFMVPFFYVLAYSGGWVNLLWMLFFTPFYGVVVMALLYPAFMLLYYMASFGGLLTVFYLMKRNARLKRQAALYKQAI